MGCRYRGMVVGMALALVSACRPVAEEPARTADPTSHRHVRTGAVVGFTGPYGAHVWRGIPYAQPPVGPLRWRAPLPPAEWAGTRPALAAAPPCTQMPSVFGGLPTLALPVQGNAGQWTYSSFMPSGSAKKTA